jgi:anaerobic selenocysteine-containing dehydrogenase
MTGTAAEPATGRRKAYRICPLCEATCGLEVTLDGEAITGVRGDRDDVFSHGFICPKATALTHLDTDPDRLRTPLIRDGSQWREAGWDEAFTAVERGLLPVLERYGDNALGFYLGNPNVHTMAGALFLGPLAKARRTRNIFSASTVDQMPKHVSSGLMFGHPLTIPVPDLDRTDFLFMLGANPYESNGSLCTAPDFPGRIKALRARGGRLVVADPRRTRTADAADEHLPVRPGTDAYLLFGMVHVLFDEGLLGLGRLADHVDGVEEVRDAAAPFTPEAVAPVCGVPAGTIRRLTRDLAAAPTAAVYARIGTCTVEFGTLTSWLVDVLNVLTGNLDQPGGAMFPLPAHKPAPDGSAARRKGFRTGRWHSRVRGLPEVLSELPAAVMAEEMLTPGDGQIRAFVTVAGNPVLSTPDGRRLDTALAGLEFMVSVDPYLNETTRHARVILPPPPLTQRGHYDFAFSGLAVRNVAKYSPPLVPLAAGGVSESEILLRLALILGGQGAGADPAGLADWLLDGEMRRTLPDRDPAELRPALTGDTVEERVLDFRLRTGAYGDGFGERGDGLSLARLREHPHGIDFGPLQPQLPEALRTTSGRIELAPATLLADVPRLLDAMGRRRDGLVLVGRRHLRSNNSWMHNVPTLVTGSNRCTLQLHPDDAKALGLVEGALARVTSAAGELEVPVEVTDRVAPGVASLPHGWGHDRPGARLSVAGRNPGVNVNVLADAGAVDPLSGNAVLSGIPVQVNAAVPAER